MVSSFADNYVILNPSPVVAQDLREAICAVRPASSDNIYLVADSAALRTLLDGWDDRGPLAVAFVSTEDADLITHLAARTVPPVGRVVLMGDGVEEHRLSVQGFDMLERPFSDADLRALLTSNGATTT